MKKLRMPRLIYLRQRKGEREEGGGNAKREAAGGGGGCGERSRRRIRKWRKDNDKSEEEEKIYSVHRTLGGSLPPPLEAVQGSVGLRA